MTTSTTSDHRTPAEGQAVRPPRRRLRRPARFAAALFVAIGLVTSLTGCSPEEVARGAIQPYWGSNTECAMRIAWRESNYHADAVNSYSGATGLFQLMPLHSTWISGELGYSWSDMKDATANSRAAKRLSEKAYAQTRDGWWPWRIGGRANPGGGCPA